MSVASPLIEPRVHHGLLRYSLHVAAWAIRSGLACYGSVVFAAPHSSDWGEGKPQWWRHEARQGLRACERYVHR